MSAGIAAETTVVLYANYNGAAAAGPALRHMTLWAVVRIAIYFSGASPERVDMFQL